ncbi:MAG: hypothetical protein ACJAT1_002382 [Marivirga sp.]|jgi:hypothetical protein
MKKAILLMTIAFLSYNVSAQTSAGSLFAGGTLQFSTRGGEQSVGANSVEKSTFTTFSFAPRVGYFISDQIAIGAGVGYNMTKDTDPDGDYSSTNYIDFSPFARYYMPVNELVNFYGQGAIGIASGGSKAVTNNTEVDTGDIFAFNVGVRAGIALFPSEHINIDLGFNIIGFNRMKNTNPVTDPAVEDVTNTFTFGFSTFSPSIGINYFF